MIQIVAYLVQNHCCTTLKSYFRNAILKKAKKESSWFYNTTMFG